MRPLPKSVLLASGAIVASLLAACGEQAGPAKPPQQHLTAVGVAAPITRELPETRELTGRLEALQTVDLRTRVGGTIEQVLVADGAEVKAGDVLFKIDEAPLKAALAKSKADVARADSGLLQAKQQFERAKKLVADKIVSQQAYDDAESAVSAAVAVQAAAAAALVNAELDLGHATITAPISGRIGRILATAGNLAQASGAAPGTLLATLVSTDPVYVVFDLDENTWRAVGARLRASAEAKGQGAAAVPVGVALAGDKGFPHQGAVTFVDNQIDSASGSIRIRATLPNPDRQLIAGAFARVQLQVTAPRPMLLINELAVQAQLTTRYVLVVDEQGITHFTPVQLGAYADGLREVSGGPLKAGDRIAVNNLTKIFFPGMPVAPVPASMVTTVNDAPPAGAPGAAPAAGDKAPAAGEKPADKSAAAAPEKAAEKTADAKSDGKKP